ncbi:tetratricopeptide repeat protein [Goodfellowiella coeruleoviolacea]|uniref:TPR repeat-containing protein n=1 Tax=Goodfellowiella coeruleoviolacea TaxID=334858 RepID=A0AAE3G8I4_9PSEU|nr:tetratricopeptide repeat protein [Goodfellowiella coeruleoviolacea]MCP2163233.1 TPR repeat-containing protein [Goodfellowiella coeruleoviolacea]
MASTASPPTPESVNQLLTTGADAYLRGDPRRALRLFDQAADLTAPHAGLRALHAEALVNRGNAAHALGDHAAAVAAYHRVLDLCDQLGEIGQTQRRITLVNLAQVLLQLGEITEAQAVLEQALALLRSGDQVESADLVVTCLLSLTSLALHRQDWARAIGLATESLALTQACAPHLAGYPLVNLAVANTGAGRLDLAEDFANQGIAALHALGDQAAVADARQNLGVIHLKALRLDAAEPLLLASHAFFEQSGMDHRAALVLRLLGNVAAMRGESERAVAAYTRCLAQLDAAGAEVEAAHVRAFLAAEDIANARYAAAEDRLRAAFAVFAARGLGPHCAQLDFWHATLLEQRATTSAAPDAELLARAVELAVPAALALDAVRFDLVNGELRDRWSRQVAAPAMRLAFRLAVRLGDARLVAELIESQCAGSPPHPDAADTPDGQTGLQLVLLDPDDQLARSGQPAAGDDPVPLGTALAGVAAQAGLRLAPPPRLALTEAGDIVLDRHIARAEQRYGTPVRQQRVIPTW